MVRLIVTRLLAAVPTLFAVVAISFFLMRLAPGGPFDQERALDPAIRANLDHLYGLDKPLVVQFGLYLESLARGDFGPSTHWRDFTVNELFARALPISVRLGTEALALALVLGVALGVGRCRSAWRTRHPAGPGRARGADLRRCAASAGVSRARSALAACRRLGRWEPWRIRSCPSPRSRCRKSRSSPS